LASAAMSASVEAGGFVKKVGCAIPPRRGPASA
jgi:hypothetical protein